ncbi:helicase HerA-like domain-containing protein [Sphingosinicella sp. BN140058]|uniref:helicase HerA-like domain-containing protein n=1 Tax=Sphingosinicella sp. BN140058 TaxID=1892855 RepID=UPI00269E5434
MASDAILIGAAQGRAQQLLLSRANRHGLIAGATGTGKTVTLQRLAEGFSAAGVPVFLADVKGDLAGIAMPGSSQAATHAALTARAAEVGLADFSYAGNPVTFWDLYGRQGHPVRTTVSEMGPLLLARLLDLNETQEGVLAIAFRVADEQGLLLLNLEDLQALLAYVGENAAALTTRYGNVTKASAGAIQRQLLQLEAQGGDLFFGEPALAIADLLAIDESGRGMINLLAADRLMTSPKLYATFLLWLLSELFEDLPEVGDLARPKLVFFFDEAHLLFDDAPKGLLDTIEQVVRLIRSKGVGVYFVTQNPADIPDAVAAQLGNRIQHALRAFTPKEQKALKAAADGFRPNPAIDVAAVLPALKVGEALVSTLDSEGAPSPVERTLIAPPGSRLGPLEDRERALLIAASPLAGRYQEPIDRESAGEILSARAEAAAEAAARAKADARPTRQGRASPSFQDEMVREVGKAVKRQVVNRIAGSLVRGLLGGLFKGR